MTRDMSRLFRPRHVAVLGSVWAENVIVQCQRIGFPGAIWPVHPTRKEVGGYRAYSSLNSLPEAPDACFIGVNRDATVEVVRTLSEIGAGGAICFASGWSETGEDGLQAKLVDAAGDMPILGPNCYGMINLLDGALLWPDQHGGQRADRGVAIISQSSNIAVNLTMQARGLPLAYVVCLGNGAQIGLSELARTLLDDPRVTALGAYVEGFDDPVSFARLAQDSGKPIAILKAGRSEAGALAAVSHTAALAGEGAVSSAYLRQIGASEVSNLAELLEVLKIFHVHGRLTSSRFCALSCSGGEAGLVADISADLGLIFPPPAVDQAQELSGLLGPIVHVSNPLDYHTFIWGDGPRTTDVFTTMLAGYDAGIFVIDPPRPDRCDPSSFAPALDAIEAAAEATGKPAFPVATLPENFDESRAAGMIERGVVPLMGLETALAALDAACRREPARRWLPWVATRPCDTEARQILEPDAKALLAGAGIPVPRGTSVDMLADFVSDSAELMPPFAIKGLGFAHKTEAGAVRLHVNNPALEPPMAGARGYLIEEMVTGGIAEMLVGLRRDPVYGGTLTLGIGGVQAELLRDTVTLVLPVSTDDVADALPRLRLWPLLDGYRGWARPDLDAVYDTVLKLQDLFAARPEFREIEINPLILRATGVVAVDALILEDIDD